MGLPVLHGVAGESARIVESEGVGIVFEPENAGQLVHELVRLQDDPALRERLRSAGLLAAGKYDRATLALCMLDSLRGVVEKQPARR